MTYEQLEGRWRDLANRMKWDAIKSAVKSMAGLQGKKFKVGGAGREPARESRRAGQRGPRRGVESKP